MWKGFPALLYPVAAGHGACHVALAVDEPRSTLTPWPAIHVSELLSQRDLVAQNLKQIIDQAVRPTAVWEMLVHASTDIQANDRITFTGQDDRIFDVIGTDQGQTELLIQKIGLVERTG